MFPAEDANGDDKLSNYKAKRDFEQTQEPSGQAAVEPSNRRRFVIQKHDATRLTTTSGLNSTASSNPGR